MNKQTLLITERSGHKLSINKSEDNKYVLEGTFTEIGVKNNNNRIYDEKEILPHIESLKEACKDNKLLGELDHPKTFDISLSNASHIIEEINYNKDTKTVTGRIRLLNTDAGKNAKALVDAGVPLHISSRAAGVVESNGHVKIKKMFTYDLVANPGFTNAQLKQVNESFGFSIDDNVQIFEVPWAMNEKAKDNTEINKKTTKENINMDAKKYVSTEDFNEYSKLVKEQFEILGKSINESTENSKDDTFKEDMTKYTDEISKNFNELSKTVEGLTENVSGLISHNDYIVENLEKVKSYSEYIGEKTDQGINYAEKLAESLDSTIEYTKMLAEKTDQSINYSEMLSKESSNRWDYQSYINENVDNLISHNDYIVEGFDSSVKYTEYIKENLENVQGYIDYVTESLNEASTTEPTTETSFEKSISDGINSIINESTEESKEESNNPYNFLSFISESKRNQFAVLSKDIQAKLVNAFSTNKWYGSLEADKVWETCFIEEPQNKKVSWLLNMPQRYVTAWNGLSESQKHAIKGQASVRLLESQYQIDNFWETRDLGNVSLVSENLNTDRPINESDEYKSSNAYMDSVKAGLRKRFKR